MTTTRPTIGQSWTTLAASISPVSRRLRQRIVSEVCRRILRDAGGQAMRTAMLVGTARSGTTWVAELIDAQVPTRLLFEPFNPQQVPEYHAFEYFQYMRPQDDAQALLAFCKRLVDGRLRGRWIDGHASHVVPELRLIKDIRATLMLRWFHERFSRVPVLYLLRHPCAVVLSRMRLRWATDEDVRRFLEQPLLVADHLGPYLDVIAAARTDEEKHAVIWCVSNLVPLRQFTDGAWTLLYYERLRIQPELELARLFEALDIEPDGRASRALQRPSRTARGSLGTVRDEVGGWKRHLTPAQVDRILAIVAAFGLDHVYGDATVPLATAPERSQPPGAVRARGECIS